CSFWTTIGTLDLSLTSKKSSMKGGGASLPELRAGFTLMTGEPPGVSRRTFLTVLGGSALAAVSLAACESRSSTVGFKRIKIPAKPEEVILASATELTRAIQAKQVSSEEVIKAHLQHLEALNPKINAIVQLTADAALAQAREADAALARGKCKGPLHGVPFT